MRIFICASKHLYHKIYPIKDELEKMGHKITLPNSFDEPMKEEKMKKISNKDHADWKAQMIRLQKEKVIKNDAVLVLNFDKNGIKNYIGGATFLEIYLAFDLNKKIFLYNSIPQGILSDELKAFQPIILNRDLNKIK